MQLTTVVRALIESNAQWQETNGFTINSGDAITVRGNSARGEADDGFQIQGVTNLLLDRNTVRSSGVGYELLDSQGTLSRNTATGSTGSTFGGLTFDFRGDGFKLYGGSLDVTRNIARDNAGDGIFANGGGTLAANTATRNGAIGIESTGTATHGGHNRAAGNAGGDCVGVACS